MGQAKQRGTLEERIAQAKEKALSGINIIECSSNGECKDITNETKMFGVMSNCYHFTKKERPDLTPEHNLLVIGIGQTPRAATLDMAGKFVLLANKEGMNLTVEKFGYLMASMIKSKMIESFQTKSQGKYWSAIKLLHG